MKLTSGFLHQLFGDQWALEDDKNTLSYSRSEDTSLSVIPYISIQAIDHNPSILSATIEIRTSSGVLTFPGAKKNLARKFVSDARKRVSIYITNAVLAKLNSMEDSSEIITTLESGDFYLNKSKIDELKETYPAVLEYFEHPLLDISRLPADIQGFSKNYKAFIDPSSEETKARNAKFVARKKKQYKELFCSLEAYPLTDEQTTAVITEEDNVLLIAAAGSGKSSTLTAKVLYLLMEGRLKPSEIIAFAYNKDAQLELQERFDSLLKRFGFENEPVSSYTFHGFCMDVLSHTEKVKPTITNIATSSKEAQLTFFNGLVADLIQSSSEFVQDLLTFYSVFKHPPPSPSEVNDKESYRDYLKSIGGRSQVGSEGRWEVVLRAMDGNEVKSLQELQICNWLFMKGIKYEYERRYEVETATQEKRQYYPDFYYPDVELWHEHFAIDANGTAPKHFENYVEEAEWKRNQHQLNETNFFETRSEHFDNDTIFDELQRMVETYNIPTKARSADEIDKAINEVFNPSRDLELLTTFLRHFKTNNLQIEGLAGKTQREKAFLRVFKPVYEAYQKKLSDRQEIDFEDLMHLACERIESGAYRSPFKYLLVDEFQDASRDRLRLLKALLSQGRDIKLFAVGDDWQSIYRFSGADLKVMTNFSTIFGFTEQLQLTHTFRSYQGIVDVAAKFIQQNPEQIKKKVKAQSSINQPSVILHPYSMGAPDKALKELLGAINRKNPISKGKISVFVLSRFKMHRPKGMRYLASSFPHLEISWKTIHASKGLEADYVLLNAVDTGPYGFPSELTDDPLLSLVIPDYEKYEHAEERRLMYVAITRAKRGFFAIYDRENPSSFVTELAKLPNVHSTDKSLKEKTDQVIKCPECKAGRLVRRDGKHGPFYGCSNYPGCKHTETLKCPQCQKGTIVKRVSKTTGNSFYACNKWPECNFTENT